MLFDVKNCKIQIVRLVDSTSLGVNWSKLGNIDEIPFTKYQIKESDFRTKTATFTSSYDIDLTTGLYVIRISSIYHENFTGVVLSKEYDEGNGLINYQCQDWSRYYQSKGEYIWTNCIAFNIIRSCLTKGGFPAHRNPTKSDREKWSYYWSGLKAIGLYEQELYKGNIIKGNPMKDKLNLIARDKTTMDIIRSLTFGRMIYIDVWFNEKGILNITPLAREDWYNTGLILSANTDRSFKFDTTNAITGGVATGDGKNIGKSYSSTTLINLNLSAFFGNVWSSVTGNKDSNTGTSTKSTGSKKTTNNTVNKTGNPYNTKKKYLMIDGDGGETVSFLREIAKHVSNAGWTVDIDTNIGPGAHSRNYKKVKNGCYMSVYNGLCADTIAELGYGYYGGLVKKNGSVLCTAWDTRTWNEGNKPYKYSIEGLKNLKTAHDWNRGSTVGSLKNPAQYMANHGVKYCVAPSAKGIADQFLAGGFRAYKGIK